MIVPNGNPSRRTKDGSGISDTPIARVERFLCGNS